LPTLPALRCGAATSSPPGRRPALLVIAFVSIVFFVVSINLRK